MKYTLTIKHFNSQIEAIIQLIKATDNIEIIEEIFDDIPNTHKKLAIKRLNEAKKNPNIMKSWLKAKKELLSE